MIYDWAARWSFYLPDKPAIKEYDSGRTLDYATLNDSGSALAQHLAEEYDIGKGDRIAILADNSLEHILLFVAAQKLGFILVPLNFRLAPPEIGYLLEDSDPKLLIVEDKYQEKVPESGQRIKSWGLESLRVFGEVGSRKSEVEKFTRQRNDDGFTRQRNDDGWNTEAGNTISEDDPILILYTSGTTGFPKGALYTYKMLFWNSINTAMSLVVNNDSRTINCMPLFHTGGWNVLLTPFFHHGGYTCLMKKFDPEVVLKLLVEEAPTIFMGVPTMLKMIADLPAFEPAKFPNLMYILVGGEPMPIPLIERWHDKEVPIRQGYGMTEVGPNLTSLHQKDATRRKGSIGKPNFYVSTKLVDANGKEVPQGEAGELLLKGPMVTPGYWNNEEATQKSIKDGWFYSGDMARADEDGNLYIVDRIKNMYISGGENVYPAEVERVLQSHEGISEAAVIGVPDERWGETGKAFIVPLPDHELSKEALQAFCREKLAGFKRPKYFVFLEELPKNDTGKVDRKGLSRQ